MKTYNRTAVAEKIHTLRATGMAYSKIATTLNETGMLTAHGRKWGAPRVYAFAQKAKAIPKRRGPKVNKKSMGTHSYNGMNRVTSPSMENPFTVSTEQYLSEVIKSDLTPKTKLWVIEKTLL